MARYISAMLPLVCPPGGRIACTTDWPLVGSIDLLHSAFDFYCKGKQRPARLVLGWVTAWVPDHEACPTHWTGCQAGQVVGLLSLSTMVVTLSCWPLPSGVSVELMVPAWQRGFSPGTPVPTPPPAKTVAKCLAINTAAESQWKEACKSSCTTHLCYPG